MKELLLRQKQILFFILAGGLSSIVEIGSFKIFSVYLPYVFPSEPDFHGIHFPFSNIFSTTLGIISNYFLSIWFVFEQGKHSKKREFAYFMGISFFTTLLSLAFFQLFFNFVFFNHLNLILYTFSPEMLSKISAIILLAIVNYTLKKRWVFNG